MSEKIKLNNVTLVGIDCVRQEEAIAALRYSMKDIDFIKVKFLSNIKPKNIIDSIDFIKIDKLTHESYSPFVLNHLYKHIDTDFCLIVHDDGFVINPHLWTNEFLSYDYIGAPWGPEYGKYRVGNGGFSLRSKKFIDLCRFIPCRGHEDADCCIRGRPFLEQNGCKFAPLDIAMKFSLETKIPECSYDLNNSFGFHGRGTAESVHFGEGQQFKDKIKLAREYING